MLRFPSAQGVIRPLATTAVLAGLLLIVRPAASASDDDGPNTGVAFSGRLVDVETRKPVEGASIVVVRSIPGVPPEAIPSWVGETKIRTASDGRFRLEFPPDQVTERRLFLALRIAEKARPDLRFPSRVSDFRIPPVYSVVAGSPVSKVVGALNARTPLILYRTMPLLSFLAST
jgi:hypothetical protein